MKLGILGGGQLARMMALAAYPLNIKCIFLDPAVDACAGPLGQLINAPYDDESGLKQLATAADCVTFEFENVPASALKALADQTPIYPPYKALLTTQDRLVEKNLFKKLGIGTATFAEVNSLAELEKAIEHLGRPAILKTRRLGYDGKGQAFIREETNLNEAWQSIGEVPATLEGYVPFDREVSIISVRDHEGETRFYSLVENVHQNGILHVSTVLENDPVQRQAEEMVKTLIDELNYVGVLVLELFQVGDKLLANEFAPRVHNSGHWTIEGAYTSQFENHVRAVTGLPLGDTKSLTPCAMINIVGDLPNMKKVLEITGTSLHLYDKEERVGRKLGHITICADTKLELQERIEKTLALI